MDEKLSKQLNLAITAVFFAAAGLLVWSAINRQQTLVAGEDETASATDTADVAATPEYASAKGFASVALAQGFASWTPDGKLDDTKTRSVTLEVVGEVAQAYLLVRATQGENTLTKWDSYYFKINHAGGHLFRPMSLPAPAEENVTVLLYDLSDVPYLPGVPYSEDRIPEKADLRAELKPGSHPVITTFISSLRPSEIVEATLSYKCAEGSDCALTIK